MHKCEINGIFDMGRAEGDIYRDPERLRKNTVDDFESGSKTGGRVGKNLGIKSISKLDEDHDETFEVDEAGNQKRMNG